MTAVLKRTDVHRPSAIEPMDYEYVGQEYMKIVDVFDCHVMRVERERIREHMARTGGTYSRHQHGGNCHVCGARAIYTVLWYHHPTNTYVRTGQDCAEKLGFADASAFRKFREGVQHWTELQTGKTKARLALAELGLEEAWRLFDMNGDSEWTDKLIDMCLLVKSRNGTLDSVWEFRTLVDIVDKMVRYGSLSDKQVAFLRSLTSKCLNLKAERQRVSEQREKERAAAEDCPTGRQEITGTIIKADLRDTNYGQVLKITVKDDRGFLVWGTAAAALDVAIREAGGRAIASRGPEKGDRVTFTATVEPSDRDSKFGFFKRPTKAQALFTALAR